MTFRPVAMLLAAFCGALFVLVAGSYAQTQKAAPPAGKNANLNDLSMEIAALQVLRDLEPTTEQLAALAKLAHESASKDTSRQPAKASPEFAAALANLHAAYVKGDDNQIGECQEKLDALMEKQEPELDNGVQISEGGQSNAADALKLLSVRQIGSFLASQEITDPVELLVSAQEQVREIKNSKDLEQEIATVAEEVGWLLYGWDDDEASQKVKDKVTALLQNAAKRKGAASANDRKAFDKEARQIVGEMDYKEVLGHIAEHAMAELLSNSRLEAAIRIQTRLASRPPTPTKTGPSKKSPNG